ncbi:MAG: hypothetical protein IJE08_15825 [Clostridia bacterium]|nr:hypothetical protein [Clostridia bacterium]
MDAPKEIRILCADLSLRCPGFAVLIWDGKAIHVDSLSHLNTRGKDMTHGELLVNINTHLAQLSEESDIFVREKGFSRFAHETQA